MKILIFSLFFILGLAVLSADLTLKNGVTYESVTYGKVSARGVTVFHKTGVITIPLEQLPEEVRGRFEEGVRKAQEEKTVHAAKIPETEKKRPKTQNDYNKDLVAEILKEVMKAKCVVDSPILAFYSDYFKYFTCVGHRGERIYDIELPTECANGDIIFPQMTIWRIGVDQESRDVLYTGDERRAIGYYGAKVLDERIEKGDPKAIALKKDLLEPENLFEKEPVKMEAEGRQEALQQVAQKKAKEKAERDARWKEKVEEAKRATEKTKPLSERRSENPWG